MLFPFVQFEFSHSLGPEAGRYLVEPEVERGPIAAAVEPTFIAGLDDELRAVGTADVLVVQIHGVAPVRGPLRRRALREERDGDKERDVSLAVATVVFGTTPLADVATAETLLTHIDDEAERERWISDALVIVNRAVSAYRAAAADPYVFDVSRTDPRTVRIGYGTPEEVYAGKWSRAFTVVPRPPQRFSRQVQLMPAQGTASILSGQGEVLESEVLLLRAQLDLEHHRVRAAAVGLDSAFELLLSELAGRTLSGHVRQQLEQAMTARDALTGIAQRARRDTLTDADAETLREHADQIGGVVDRWRYEPLGY